MGSTTSRRFAAAVVAAGMAGAGLLGAPAASASPHGHGHGHGHGHPHCYQAPVQSNPQLSVRPARGGAVATLSVAQHLSGHAVLSVRPGRTYSLQVSHGSASQFFPTHGSRTYLLSAMFAPSGNKCAIGGSTSGTYRASSAHGGYTATNAKISLASSQTRPTAAPVSNGPDGTAALVGVLGVGLLGAGATSVAVNRRRNRASS